MSAMTTRLLSVGLARYNPKLKKKKSNSLDSHEGWTVETSKTTVCLTNHHFIMYAYLQKTDINYY